MAPVFVSFGFQWTIGSFREPAVFTFSVFMLYLTLAHVISISKSRRDII